jgi:antitoxin component YwqK of YwqJK toxin-antitoxin module
MLKQFFIALFFCSGFTVFSQVQIEQKFYFIQHHSLEGLKLIPCSKDVATHYSIVDPEILTNTYVTYYYLNGKKFMLENYESRQLQSRKVYHPNGKKCYVEKRTMEVVGSAGTSYGNNVQLYQFPLKMISAWDTSGIRTLKDGEGVVNEYDYKGNLRHVKSYKNQRIYTIMYKSTGYYSNGKIMFEEENNGLIDNRSLIKYVLNEQGDTLVKKGTGKFISKFSNDSLYVIYDWYNGKIAANTQFFFPNGKVQNEILTDEKFTYYYDNGQIRVSGEWQKGNRFGEWRWFDRKGKLVEQKTFDKFDLFKDAVF